MCIRDRSTGNDPKHRMEAKSPLRGILYGSVASCVAEAATMPIDVIKVRLQYQGSDGTLQYKNLREAFRGTVRAEGVNALFKGIKPAMVRQFTYGGLRSVSYTHLRAHETPEHLVCRLLLEKKKH
eukprot:TRINITY_DN53314_c0_g1_i1.p1 TRINITY_DN53314_c0_g1~~TRINITY_DN53314_c0_g1_i1.p1  ORF type:complete len:134 (+),score=38.99 TRINITY_DN53314_c0_g1_i1:28-402(+)